MLDKQSPNYSICFDLKLKVSSILYFFFFFRKEWLKISEEILKIAMFLLLSRLNRGRRMTSEEQELRNHLKLIESLVDFKD